MKRYRVLCGSLFFLVCMLWATTHPVLAQAATPPLVQIVASDHVRGNPKAPVMLVVYADLECPFCKTFHETLAKVIAEYGPSGKVAWTLRHFPLEQLFPNSPKIAEASECVAELGGNTAFFTFVDLVFSSRSIDGATDMSRLPTFAQMSGVHASSFSTCLASGKYKAKVAASLTEGTNAGVQGTPHTFILVRGQSGTLNGAQPYETVKNIIDNLLDQEQGPLTIAPSIDLKINGKDTPLSFTGKKKLSLTWNAEGVSKKCFISVARGKMYTVAPVGSKKITVDSQTPYISFDCTVSKTGEAISDLIPLSDPRGTIDFVHMALTDPRTISVTASGHVTKPICTGQFFGTIAWGDGTSDKVGPELKGTANCSTTVTDTQTHYYSKTGTYRLTFTDKFKRKTVSKVTID